jgi:hypothetical protein
VLTLWQNRSKLGFFEMQNTLFCSIKHTSLRVIFVIG